MQMLIFFVNVQCASKAIAQLHTLLDYNAFSLAFGKVRTVHGNFHQSELAVLDKISPILES